MFSLIDTQHRWGREYEHTLFSNGMVFSDEGKVVQDKMLNAVVQQGGFVAAFTGVHYRVSTSFLLHVRQASKSLLAVYAITIYGDHLPW